MAQTIGDSTLLDAWASDGEIEEPDISKIEQGWLLGEQPPHEFFNWIQNTFGQKINHVLQRGVASWDSGKDYEVGDVVGSGGSVWIAQDDNTDSEPGSSNTDWASIGLSDIGQNITVFDTDGVTEWDVPDVLQSGLRKAKVTVTGGGGGSSEDGLTDGGNGSTSSFGAFCSATGGLGGEGSLGFSGAGGGQGSGGDINIAGGGSGPGADEENISFSGGASYWGGGGRGRQDDNPTSLPGGSGDAPGAGAGGCLYGGAGYPSGAAGGTSIGLFDLTGETSVTVTVGAGGEAGGGTSANGADGIVIVEW